MSDFGTVILARKKDGDGFLEEEKSGLCASLDRILNNGEYENALGEPFNNIFEPYPTQEGALAAKLSDHKYTASISPDEKLEEFNFVEDMESSQANHIRDMLAIEFPALEFEAKLSDW